MPDTPATPKTSPARISKLIRFKRGTPWLSVQLRCLTLSRTSPASTCSLLTLNNTLRPTICSASWLSLVIGVSKWATIAPLRITETVSVTAIISRSLWVIRIMVTPCALRAAKILNNSSVSCGVNTPVGSSSMSILAPLYRALRISTRCCKPTDKLSTVASKSTSKPYFSSSSLRLCLAACIPSAKSCPPSAPKITFSNTVKLSTNIKC